MAELLKVARLEPDYAALPEERRQAVLLALLDDARPLRVIGHRYSDLAHEELEVFEAALKMRAAYGPDSLRHYIISHTEEVSDLLEVLLLQKETGLMRGTLADSAEADLIVVPLFETIGDLERAEPIMRAFYALPGIVQTRAARRRRAGHHARLQRQQQGRRLLHQQLVALPRRDRARAAVRRARPRARHPAAPLPRPRRHGGPRRRAELRGHPRAAAGHRERADPPHGAGRGHRVEVRPPRDRPAQPRDAGGRDAWKRRCCTPRRARRRPSSTRRTRSARRAWRPTAASCTRRPASPTTSSPPRRSARSPS